MPPWRLSPFNEPFASPPTHNLVAVRRDSATIKGLLAFGLARHQKRRVCSAISAGELVVGVCSLAGVGSSIVNIVHFLSVPWPGTARAKGQLAATLRRIYLR
jgi:hypothetical protein